MSNAIQRSRTRRARHLRSTQSNGEAIFWQCVRNRGFMNLKFRRQRPFGRYVLDFFCEELNLAVELDGVHHLESGVAERDAERTEFLQSRGLTVVRVENEELIVNPHMVFDRLGRIIAGLRKLAADPR